ncbi:alpha/beta hydrolase [Amycolatopsis nigrescens]|uniref:alpha/beta hydrolase n=1 Tax=Amycolatopsis nigrescens TaxID=381445 RepID=UPI00036052ED|nr:alpha/beta hydrolase [Amycolatopsis nigrescens]
MAEFAAEGATAKAERATPPGPVIEHKGGASRGSKLLAVFLRVLVRPVLALYARWPGLPWPFWLVDRIAVVLRARRGTVREPVRLADCRAEWLRGPGVPETGASRAILYLHGGAFVCCGLCTHRRLVSSISAAGAAPVLAVDYRMLPAAPISSAVTDGVTGYRWLLDRGFSPDRIVIAGDSAGGYLAFVVALALLEKGLPRPAGIAALSPLTDLDPAGKAVHPNATRDPLFPPGALEAIGELAERTRARVLVEGSPGPLVSPVDEDLSALPPSLIQVGSTELLLPDAELMAERLAAAGVPARLQVWADQVHVFQAAADFLPQGREAIRDLGAFIREVTP